MSTKIRKGLAEYPEAVLSKYYRQSITISPLGSIFEPQKNEFGEVGKKVKIILIPVLSTRYRREGLKQR
jgi:hypothetical protein